MNLKNYSFFLTIPLGLELIALEELNEKSKLFDIQVSNTVVTTGGIELDSLLEEGILLNHILKIPTKILLRLTSFKARDYPKIFNKMKKYNWSSFLLGPNYSVSASAQTSRVMNSTKIEETLSNAINYYFEANAISKKKIEILNSLPPYKLYCRAVDDVFTISLDTTGESPWKKHQTRAVGVAPIRSNIASALLYYSYKNMKDNTLGLLDGMCGSGSFTKESISFYRVNREFNFSYPNIQSINIDLINEKLKEMEKIKQCLYQEHICNDIDFKCLDYAKDNLKDEDIVFHNLDLFNLPIETKSALIINPPYNVRIKVKDIDVFYSNIYNFYEKEDNIRALGIIIPNINKSKFEKLINKKYSIKKLKLKNGGINVTYYHIDK